MKVKLARWLGVAGALLVPAVAVAVLDIPNTFSAGQTVSAALMNANFAAIKSKVEELEGDLASRSVNTWVELPNSNTPLLNNWVVYDNATGFTQPAYLKDANGFVHLKGIVEGGAANSAIVTLPAGYRPLERHIFFGYASGGEAARIDVAANGTVVADPGAFVSSLTSVSLDGITFLAEQ